jgi:dipeptidyl aminopeptidase/acylaminoacyl peptidase
MEPIGQQHVGNRRSLWIAATLGLLAITGSLATFAARSEAAFPGTPGKISFDSTRDGNTEIYVMNADGSQPTRLTDNPAIDRDAAFSPDGRTIAFVSDRDGNSEVYVMNADGSGQTRLTNNTADDFQPAFSPDGSKIAFMSNRGVQGDMEIFLMNADGSGETRLTNNTSFEGQPTFSPDGQRIAFASDRDGNFEIYTMNTDGSNPTRLTNSAASESRPNFSPDGSRIAFRTDRDGNGEIYVMNADGTHETRLTTDPALDGEPAFSPDGQQIAFRSHRVNDKADIYVMNADGSAQTNLTIGQTFPDGEPAGQFADRRPDWQPVPTLPPPPNAAPTASYSFSCVALSCSFDASGSTDSDGRIVDYSWAFGDGTSASGVTAEHTYAQAGTYTVVLTVTDDDSATAADSKSITVSSTVINLSAARVYKLKGVGKVDLSWKVSGPSTGIFDVYRGDAGKIARDVKAYGYTDSLGRGASGSYTYQVCEAGSTLTCSNQVTVTF